LKNIDPNELVALMAFYPTLDETAAWFNCSSDSIERRVKELYGCSFKSFRDKNAGKTRLLLKRKAISKALEEDNEKMLLYCLRTMTDLDDRTKSVNDSVFNKRQSVEYTLEFLSEEEKKL
jgi:hypothetical protein